MIVLNKDLNLMTVKTAKLTLSYTHVVRPLAINNSCHEHFTACMASAAITATV